MPLWIWSKAELGWSQYPVLVTDLNFRWRMQLRKIHRQWKVSYNPFSLFKNSGKLKTDEENSASVHDISDYLLCEIHGTTVYNTLA